MKAVVINEYGGPEVLQVVEREIPQPGPGEVLLRMHAAGVGKPDYLMRTGNYPWTKDILPFSPGLYGAGVIEALGAGVEGLAVGTPVFIDHPIACSCYSEYKLAPAERVVPLPEGTDLERAAIITNYLIAWAMLTRMCVPSEGKTLYIKGAAGALGTALLQLAPRCGLTTIASASSQAKCDYLRELGVNHVFCYKERDELDAVMEYTNGRGVDFLFDQCAGSRFAAEIPMLAKCGFILIYNTLDGFPQENVIELLTNNFGRCIGVRAFSFHLFDDDPEGLNQLRREVFGMLARGEIKPYIGATFDQADVVKAHEALDAGSVLGSIILRI